MKRFAVFDNTELQATTIKNDGNCYEGIVRCVNKGAVMWTERTYINSLNMVDAQFHANKLAQDFIDIISRHDDE